MNFLKLSLIFVFLALWSSPSEAQTEECEMRSVVGLPREYTIRIKNPSTGALISIQLTCASNQIFKNCGCEEDPNAYTTPRPQQMPPDTQGTVTPGTGTGTTGTGAGTSGGGASGSTFTTTVAPGGAYTTTIPGSPTNTPDPVNENVTQKCQHSSTGRDMLDTQCRPINCKFWELPNSMLFYIANPPGGLVTMMCPGGTYFKLWPDCRCEHSGPVAYSCKADVIIRLQQDKAISRSELGSIVPISNLHDHLIQNNSIMFDTSYKPLLINTLNLAEFRDGLSVYLEFQELGSLTNRQILITNCNPDQGPSLEIAIDKNNVEFKVDLGLTNYFQHNIPYKPDGVKRVTFIYDNEVLTAQVDDSSRSVSIAGTLVSRAEPFYIGNTECRGPGDGEAFVGLMNNIKVYKCPKNSLKKSVVKLT